MPLVPGRLYRILAPHATLGIFRRQSPLGLGPAFQMLQLDHLTPYLFHQSLYRCRGQILLVDEEGIEDVPVGIDLHIYLRERYRLIYPDFGGWFRR